MSKRSSSDNSGNGDMVESQTKRKRNVEFEPVRICSISGVKDIDNKVLKAQHYKLCERFRHKEKLRQILEKRVEELEGRQAKDDEVSCIINRYWNRMDEDVQVLLQRFDADASLDFEEKDVSDENVKHFLAVLSNWGLEEIEEKLSQRVEFTSRALSKLVQVFDKVVQSNSHLSALISGEKDPFIHSRLSSPDDKSDSPAAPESPKKEIIEEELRNYCKGVLEENVRLQRLVTHIQADNHRLSVQSASKDDQLSIMENRLETLNNKLEDVQYEYNKSLMREEKLDYRLAEYIRKEQIQQVQVPVEIVSNQNGVDEVANVSKAKLEELQQELDLQVELASNRLTELQEMTERNKTLSAELEQCEMKLKYIPAEVIRTFPEYTTLQSNYSSLLDDCKALRLHVDDLKQQLTDQKLTHSKQVERMKNEEALAQERMQETLLELDGQLNMVRKEYDTLCIEFEHSTAANEQAGPINEQVLALMKTYSMQNEQLKLDVSRYKRKCLDATTMLLKCQKELDSERKISNENYLIIKLEEEPPEITSPDAHNNFSVVDGEENKFYDSIGTNGADCNNSSNHVDCPASSSQLHDNCDIKVPKSELNSSDPNYPTTPSSNDSFSRQLKMERDKLKDRLRILTKMEKKEKVKYYTDEVKKKLRMLEEQVEKLRKELTNAKQEEEGLMNEMESTGQAFEEMQEQNQKLVQQLREKDEANLNLMGERIRYNQAQKKIKEEKEILDSMLVALDNKLTAKNFLCQKLEEKERALMENRSTLEHELRLRDQTNEMLKRKAAESAQFANDLRLRLDKLTSQFNEAQYSIKKKAASYEATSTSIKRLEEEKNSLKRLVDRAKRMEKFDNIDKVLEEENRLLKEALTCPSCKVHRKDAILTKCHHVFCYGCIKKRYETRQRKCPKCNAGFGKTDYHRIFIE